MLFFCRRFLFQIKRKCRNAGNIKSLTMVGRECRVQILRVHIVPLSRQRVVGVADPYKIRGNKIVRGSRANDICPYRIPFHYSLLPITLSKAKQTPQSRLCRASSPAGEPKSRRSLFCLPLNKIYAILNSALRRDSPCGCPLSAKPIQRFKQADKPRFLNFCKVKASDSTNIYNQASNSRAAVFDG